MKVTGSSIQQLDRKRADGSSKPKSECRKWRLWVTTEEGRKSKRVSGTYTKAQKELDAFVKELDGVVPNSETFGSYADSWVQWCRDYGNYAPGTIANFERDARALKRVLGGDAMDSITPEACKAALTNLKHGGSASGRELSNTYMAEMHSTLKMMFQTAEDDGRIASNPMAKVKAPKPDTAEREWLEPMELGLFLNRLDKMELTQWTVTLYLIAMLGLRRGEACAIYDEDVDIESDGFGYVGTAHIRRAIKEATARIDEPKTKSGIRDLPMPDRLCRVVLEWRKVREKTGLRDARTLCCNSNGGAMHPQNLARWWRLNRDKLGCRDMGLHQLRHSNLSMMARRMSVFDLKDWAGWSSIEPAKVYVHRDMDSMRAAVVDVWSVIGSQSDAPKTHQNEKQARA